MTDVSRPNSVPIIRVWRHIGSKPSSRSQAASWYGSRVTSDHEYMERHSPWSFGRFKPTDMTDGPISLWLYKENCNLRDWKKLFTLHIPPWAYHTCDFVLLTSLTHPRKTLLVVLQTTRPQLTWLPQCSELPSLEVFFEVSLRL
jgi:hypothetical protein